MLPFALTIFTGAFLLFQVQPLIGKYILPWFGGSPGVWTVCLLFFQALLLGGYAYAHFLSSRFRLRTQVFVHLALVAIALVTLPITPSESWKPAEFTEPTLRILLLLSATIGLPYFVLSATGPLVQQWFGAANPGVSPYRLYALSNVGSLLALLSYPFYFEPHWTRFEQAKWWGVGLAFYGLCVGACAWWLLRRPATVAVKPEPVEGAPTDKAPRLFRDKALWLAFPALASVLLLAVTNKLCQDVAVIPFLWVLPLALYLVSFILCFDHPRWYSRGVYTALFAVSLCVVGVLLLETTSLRLAYQVGGYALVLFVGCMICHGELYRLKPAPARLTQYYLFIAAGGALGGWFVAILAPAIFSRYVELQIALWLLTYLLGTVCILHQARSIAVGLAVGALLGVVVIPILYATKTVGLHGWPHAMALEFKIFFREFGWYAVAALVAMVFCLLGRRPVWSTAWNLRQAGVPMLLTLLLGIFFVVQMGEERGQALESSRNFYGTLTVMQRKASDDQLRYNALTHGNITHGLQFTEPPLTRLITTYYGENSGVGRAIGSVPTFGGRKIGVVGLGTGTLAMYGTTGDKIRIYEINPAVEQLARSRFTFLQQSGGDVKVVLGDARLVMESELKRGEIQNFDVLALDAFSSDAIPVHLLTKEAFELYLMHVTWDGIIAVHTSNRYLALEPAIYRVARELGLQVVTISDNPDDSDWWLYRSTWLLLTRSDKSLTAERIVSGIRALPSAPKDVRLWTDDYATLLPLLR